MPVEPVLASLLAFRILNETTGWTVVVGALALETRIYGFGGEGGRVVEEGAPGDKN